MLWLSPFCFIDGISIDLFHVVICPCVPLLNVFLQVFCVGSMGYWSFDVNCYHFVVQVKCCSWSFFWDGSCFWVWLVFIVSLAAVSQSLFSWASKFKVLYLVWFVWWPLTCLMARLGNCGKRSFVAFTISPSAAVILTSLFSSSLSTSTALLLLHQSSIFFDLGLCWWELEELCVVLQVRLNTMTCS